MWELAEAFELFLNNLSDIFQLPDLKSNTNRLKTKNNPLEENLIDVIISTAFDNISPKYLNYRVSLEMVEEWPHFPLIKPPFSQE